MTVSSENGRVPLRDLFDLRFDALEERLDARDAALDEKLDAWCKGAQGDIDDHEVRLRSLEKQSNWHWIGQAVTTVAAFVGIKTGFGN